MGEIIKFPSKAARSVTKGLQQAIAYVRGDKSAAGRVTNYWYDHENDQLYAIDENGKKRPIKKT